MLLLQSANSLYQRWLRGCDGTCYIQCIFTYECIPRTTRMQIHTCTATLDGFHGFWKICLYLKYTTVNYKETIHIPTIGRIYHFLWNSWANFGVTLLSTFPPKITSSNPSYGPFSYPSGAPSEEASGPCGSWAARRRLPWPFEWHDLVKRHQSVGGKLGMVACHGGASPLKLAASRKYIQWHKVI